MFGTDDEVVSVSDQPQQTFGADDEVVAEPNIHNPIEIDASARAAFDISQQHSVPLYESQQLVAGPEPSAFGRMLGKIKDLADEYILRPQQVAPELERWGKFGKEAVRAEAAVGSEAASKLSLGALDVLTNKTMGDKTLADMVLRVGGLRDLSDEERVKAETLGYLPAFVLPGMAVSKALSYVPAANWLKTVLGAGLTFATTDAALQESRKLVTGQPIDWSGVHLQGGIGVLFGTGAVAVNAAMSGIAKGIEKYWGERGIEVAEKIRMKYPAGERPTLAEQTAKQEAEVRSDVTKIKDIFRKGRANRTPEEEAFIDSMREKYVTGKPPEGSAMAEPVVAEPVKPAVVETVKPSEPVAIAVKKPPVSPVEVKTPEIPAVVGQEGTIPLVQSAPSPQKQAWVTIRSMKLPENTEPKYKYDVQSEEQATQAAYTKAKETGKEQYVYATSEGLRTSAIQPPITQNHFAVLPDGTVETRVSQSSADAMASTMGNAAKDGRRQILQNRIKRGQDTGTKLLEEFRGEQWADAALAKTEQGGEMPKVLADAKKIRDAFPYVGTRPYEGTPPYQLPKGGGKVWVEVYDSREGVDAPRFEVVPVRANKGARANKADAVAYLENRFGKGIDEKVAQWEKQQQPPAKTVEPPTTPEQKRTATDAESEQDLRGHIDNPDKPPPSARNKGIALVPPQVEEVLSFLERGADAAKGVPITFSYAVRGAANHIEKTYTMPEGKQLAADIRKISFEADRHKATQMRRIETEAGLNTLTEEEKIQLVLLGQGRIDPSKVSSKVLSVEKQVRAIWDEDLDAANIAGYKRKVGDQWMPLKRTERWMPQLLNKDGQRIVELARRKGLGDAKVSAACDAMVAMKSAVSPEDALDKMLKYRDISVMNGSMRGIDGNLESTRTLMPEYMIETDPGVILPNVLATNAKMLAAAEEWHVMSPETKSSGLLFKDMSAAEIKAAEEAGTVTFEALEPILGAIKVKYGPGDAEALRKWIGTSFGRSNDIPAGMENLLNFINNTETRLKLDYALTGALRNAFQGPGNLFTASPLDTIKGLWNALEVTKEGKEISEMIRRSGAIHGVKEMGEIVGGKEGETGMQPFMAAEHWSQKTAAAIALESRLKTNIQDLANYQKGSALDKILIHLKYISVNPEGYLKDLLKNRTFTQPITDEQLEQLWTRPPTLNEMQQVAYRIVVDSQFAQTLASKPIPWNNPFFRVAMKFKTYSINQTRWVWNEAVKQALKGTYRPLLLYFAYSALIGEIWNLSRDLIRGGDNSITSMLANREEKRNAKDITMAIFNNFTDGTGLGIIADLGYGLGSMAMGPVGGTVKNVGQWAGNLRHPLTATEKLIRQEFTAMKDASGLMNRFDAWFINQNNHYFEYVRTRDRTFDFDTKKKTTTLTDKAWQTAKQVAIGPTRYQDILPYEYAAKQITIGDIDDAADYLADAIRADSRDTETIRRSIERSMRNYSPLGHLAEEDKAEFMKQFDPADRRSMETLQTKWLADYKKATDKAFKMANKKNTSNRRYE